MAGSRPDAGDTSCPCRPSAWGGDGFPWSLIPGCLAVPVPFGLPTLLNSLFQTPPCPHTSALTRVLSLLSPLPFMSQTSPPASTYFDPCVCCSSCQEYSVKTSLSFSHVVFEWPLPQLQVPRVGPGALGAERCAPTGERRETTANSKWECSLMLFLDQLCSCPNFNQLEIEASLISISSVDQILSSNECYTLACFYFVHTTHTLSELRKLVFMIQVFEM